MSLQASNGLRQLWVKKPPTFSGCLKLFFSSSALQLPNHKMKMPKTKEATAHLFWLVEAFFLLLIIAAADAALALAQVELWQG